MTDGTNFNTKAQVQGLSKMQKGAREAYLQNGIKAWQAYQANGLHVTGKEADAWLGILEAGRDVAPPECHARPPPHA